MPEFKSLKGKCKPNITPSCLDLPKVGKALCKQEGEIGHVIWKISQHSGIKPIK
jgi:hypothetical protein